MSGLVVPNIYIEEINNPLIFLAGPIRGAKNWQDKAIEFLFSEEKDLIIASPRRGIRKEIEKYILKGDEDYFPRQRVWEWHYLNLASKTGAILFWLPEEWEHSCNKVYGAMTRMELGEWMIEGKYNPNIKFCVGSNGDFPEIHTIEYDLKHNAPEIIIKDTLEKTCVEALKLVYRRDI